MGDLETEDEEERPKEIRQISENCWRIQGAAPLDEVEESYSFVVEDEEGSNTILVEPGRIRVSEADCPDQVCVNQGFISDGTVPVVCLPHKLMIEIVGGGSEFDAAAG